MTDAAADAASIVDMRTPPTVRTPPPPVDVDRRLVEQQFSVNDARNVIPIADRSHDRRRGRFPFELTADRGALPVCPREYVGGLVERNGKRLDIDGHVLARSLDTKIGPQTRGAHLEAGRLRRGCLEFDERDQGVRNPHNRRMERHPLMLRPLQILDRERDRTIGLHDVKQPCLDPVKRNDFDPLQ